MSVFYEFHQGKLGLVFRQVYLPHVVVGRGVSRLLDENGLDKELKAREEKLKQAMLVEQNLWKEEYLNRQHTEDEYNQALQDSEMKFLLAVKS